MNHGHRFPSQTEFVPGLKHAHICLNCGVARVTVKGQHHYWTSYEYEGIGVQCASIQSKRKMGMLLPLEACIRNLIQFGSSEPPENTDCILQGKKRP